MNTKSCKSYFEFFHLSVRLQVTTCHIMDDKWFKQQQKIAGVTAADIAEKMGRDRSVVSHIYQGRQRMSLEWAKAFANVLGVSIDLVLEKAGAVEPAQARTLAPGFAESDTEQFIHKAAQDRHIDAFTKALGCDRPGIDAWRVKSNSMVLGGYLVNDVIVVDTHLANSSRAGDIVLAQIYNHQTGSASTVLRRLEPPVLIAASPSDDDQGVLVVDGNNVVLIGKVIGSCRTTQSRAD